VRGSTLVTGGTGFAGSHLIEHLLARGQAVASLAHPGGRPAQNADGVEWRHVDLLDRLAVRAAVEELAPSAIYHCAGVAHINDAAADPTRALRVNAMGTHYLLDAVAEARIDCPVLVTGSALVYRPSTDALHEDSPLGPSNPYGFSKLAQEMTARRSTRARVFIVRPFNHAGPRQSPAYVTSSFAKQIAEIERGTREPVVHVGNLDPGRDVTDVRDTVAAYVRIVERGVPGRPYNVCCGRGYRIGDLLQTLVRLARVSVEVRSDPDRVRTADTPMVLGDPARVRAETGWEPAIPIERTLGDLLEYWRHQLAGSAP
jgi:GDP-4-dehydro-6-deoxy-D-mannose reductase